MKKAISGLLTLFMILSLFTFDISAKAQTTNDITYAKDNFNQIWVYSCDNYASGEIVIPDHVNGYPVVGIYTAAFSGCSYITSVKLPSTIYYIGDNAFNSCISLEKINVPDNVSYLGEKAFTYCKSLKDINIPKNINSILHDTFYECDSLSEIDIPGNVVVIDYDAFMYCDGLINVNISEGVNKIGNQAFWKCTNLKKVHIPSTVYEIGTEAFQFCKNLTDVYLAPGVYSISIQAFADTGITKIKIPASVMYIEPTAFDDCNTTGYVTIQAYKGTAAEELAQSRYYLKLERLPDVESLVLIDGKLHYVRNEVVCSGVTAMVEHEGIYYFVDKDGWVNLNYTGLFDDTKGKIYYAKNGIVSFDYTGLEVYTGTRIYQLRPSITVGESQNLILYIDNSEPKLDYTGMVVIENKQYNIENGILTHKYSSTYQKDSEQHWKECSICGEKDNVSSHEYKDATCITPKTCKDCGATSGNKLSHSYDSGKVTKKATCKATGIRTYTCSVCKGTKTETIAKSKTHSYTNSCDTKCNICNAKRSITHAYKITSTKATLTKNGSVVKKCSVCGKVYSKSTIRLIKSVKLSSTTYTYNGKVKTPSVVVKDSAGKTLKKNTDYTVKYSSGKKNVGKYTVTVTFKGKYSGTKKLTFTIKPVKTTAKLTAGKKALTVKVNKKTAQVSGYQIQYSTSKSFKSSKTVNLSKNTKTSTTIKKLTAKKTYYVRVRTYKTVGKTKYYSGWSTIVSKKTK